MAGYYNCSECGMPTSNRGLCVDARLKMTTRAR